MTDTPDTATRLNAAPLPLARHLGIRFLSAEADEVVAELEITDALCTSGSIMHGGTAMALADTVGAVATFLNLPEGAAGTTTIESKTNFLAACPAGQVVRATATPVHRGRRTQMWQTKITRADGKLVAITSQTQMVL
jgi:uncharacterized protein (TIGR00369 family)